ncbi:redoxin domain-containing protein [bacterium]|nr:redoxin domain-containing protein [bacterium]MBU1983998.1 redoxin domain-containing protein [bacterium]
MRRLDLPSDRMRAPEFPKEFAWVNSDRRLSLRDDLAGNVVVLDFWTYCCINCMHVLPDLEYIEHKYAGQPVVVIGVHSAKFDNESDPRNIETACARYDIAHPVIVDEGHRIWSTYGVRAWPTLVVLDPEGRVVGTLSGEGNRHALDAIVYTLLEEGRENGTLAASPPSIRRSGRVTASSGLAFPGKVLAESSGKFVFISDSNHDRVIVADPTGLVIAVAGSGRKGRSDGTFADAEFDNPQGLAYDSAENVLYVADTDNHLIRRLDLSTRLVETVAGTGEQVYDRAGGRVGRFQGLNSPWDLALIGDTLYIAMAGSHQLWVLDTKTFAVRAWAGSGYEDIQDGDGQHAALAQPSGFAYAGDWLYFADSEVSAVRKVNLKTREVMTLIGRGLFDFGDRDGKLSRALLQHPLGVAVHGDEILVADTYNHKIKRIHEAKGTVETIAGTGESLLASAREGELVLYEPGGISVAGDTLYIADTNHDRVIRYNLLNNAWSEFALRGLYAATETDVSLDHLPMQRVNVRPGAGLVLRLSADFADSIHLNTEAPIHYAFGSIGGIWNEIEGDVPPGKLPVTIRVPASALDSSREYLVELSLAYCTSDNRNLCVPTTLAWRLKPAENAQADSVTQLSGRIAPIRETISP